MNHTVTWLLGRPERPVSQCHSGVLVSSHIWQRMQSRFVLWKWAESNLGLILDISAPLTWVTPRLPHKQRTLRPDLSRGFQFNCYWRTLSGQRLSSVPGSFSIFLYSFYEFHKLNTRFVKFCQVLKLEIFISESSSRLFCLQVGVHLPSVLKVM